MSNKQATKHKFRYGEETYTIFITKDDWWIDEPVDMPERMITAANEFALENGMAPDADLCVGCNKGIYLNITEDYNLASKVIKNLPIRRCNKCGHTLIPGESVARVDEVLGVKN